MLWIKNVKRFVRQKALIPDKRCDMVGLSGKRPLGRTFWYSNETAILFSALHFFGKPIRLTGKVSIFV